MSVMDEHRRPPLPEMPCFEDFYQAVNDRLPFPWQERLAAQIDERAEWPSAIEVPTGLGKTACLDIAVWWLASQAQLPAASRSAPTRIWWVVNRRLLVDEASKHAERLKQVLNHPGSEQRAPAAQETLRRVAARLRSVKASPDGDPLHVFPMRGGITLKRPPNPAQPSVIVATIPMYGSRLLFRGYGTLSSMRPIDAALAGTDSLVLVDEAHLARHLRDLIPKLRECTPGSAVDLLPACRSAPQVVSLTATGSASDRDRFELNDDDRANETVRNRLDAAKPMRIDADQKGAIAKALCDAAVGLLSEDGPASCVVFCNTPAVARDAFGLIRSTKLGAGSDCRLVTGRTRQAEADNLRDRLLSRSEGAPAIDRRLPQRERHLVVVATQTLEVGADLDFEYLVTEQCGVRALTQRLGRLNRLGNHRHARAVYVHRPPPKTSRRASADDAPDSWPPSGGWPVYGSEPDMLLNRLAEQGHENEVDLNPRVVADRLGEPEDDPGRAPEVLPGILWEWVKTTTSPHGEAPVEPYFSGIAEQSQTVAVLWRAYVPEMAPENEAVAHGDAHEPETAGNRQLLWPRVSQDEIVEVPVWELRQALGKHRVERVVRQRRDSSDLEPVRRRDLQPGDLVILPTDEGMHDEFGWAPDDHSPVTDVSVKRSGLPLDEAALRRLCGGHAEDTSTEIRAALQEILGNEDEVPDDALARDAAERLITLLRDNEAVGFTREQWNDLLDALDPTPLRPPNEVPRLGVRYRSHTASLDESDEVSLCESLGPEAMQLVAHGKKVGERARRLGTALGLPTPLVELIARAGDFHDIGKSDERFQRWLNPDLLAFDAEPDYTPMAKSNMARSRWRSARAESGWPSGGRHEELSARLVQKWLAAGPHGLNGSEQDLLVHLVVSHHGKGRPLVVPVADGTASKVRWTFADGTHAHATSDLSQTDWHQPARFHRLNERYGPWGLALLEALVRQADHEVSAATEVQ